MIWEVGFIAATVCTACIIVGVQVIFYTKSFEEEYKEKIDKIREIRRWELDEKVKKLCTPYMKSKGDEIEDSSENREIFPEFREDIRQNLLDAVVKGAQGFYPWFDKIPEGKRYLRQLGGLIILFGVSAFGFGVVVALFGFSSAALLFIEVTIILLFFAIRNAQKYFKLLNFLDEKFKEVERKTVII
jgi:hypothetical protein